MAHLRNKRYGSSQVMLFHLLELLHALICPCMVTARSACLAAACSYFRSHPSATLSRAH